MANVIQDYTIFGVILFADVKALQDMHTNTIMTKVLQSVKSGEMIS